MIDIIVMILIATSFLFAIVALYTKNSLFKSIAGTSFLILGLMILIGGIDVQSGINVVSDISSNETQYSNSTAVYTTYNNYFISGLGLLFVLIGLFLFASVAWYEFYSEKEE